MKKEGKVEKLRVKTLQKSESKRLSNNTARESLQFFLEERLPQFLNVFEHIADAYLIMDIQGNVLNMNVPAKKLFGYDLSKEAFNVVSLIYKDDYDYAMQSYTKLLKDGVFNNYEARIYTKSKNVKWVQINANLIFNDKKEPIAAQGIIRDITELKANFQSIQDQKAELESIKDQLLASEDQLATVIASMDNGILFENDQRKIKLTNQKFCDLFNIPVKPENFVGLDCKALSENEAKYAFKNPDFFVEDVNNIIANKKIIFAQELEMADGRIFERDYIPIFDKKDYRGHLWCYRDVTFKKRHKQQLEKERTKFSSILENMNMGIIETDLGGQILFANQSFLTMSGYQKEELLGKKGNDIFIKGESQKAIRDAIENRKKGISYSYEVEVETKEGDTRYWLISGAPNYNENNEIIGTIGAHLDITELKQLELEKENLLEQLEASNEELREYAHIVSHDLKSPLRSVSALISWLKEDYASVLDKKGLKNFDLIESKIEMMDALIEGILGYSSAGESSEPPELVNLNEIVEDIQNILYKPDHISIKVKNKLPTILVNKIKMQQVFQNLISNAINHIDKEKGMIEVSCEEKEEIYQFGVSDNGVGIAEEYHDKIFEIFQSVDNGEKRSTGIGLSIVKKIVNLYKGEIWVDSEINIGSTFYFTIAKNDNEDSST